MSIIFYILYFFICVENFYKIDLKFIIIIILQKPTNSTQLNEYIMNFTSIIDNARAYGKVRELKIKMDESNIKDLCDIDPDFCEYAIEKEESFDTTIGETMVIEFIKLLKDKTLNLNDICEIMMTKYKKIFMIANGLFR